MSFADSSSLSSPPVLFFFFNDTATTEIYTLSLHDALPIFSKKRSKPGSYVRRKSVLKLGAVGAASVPARDRKSTRLNSSHLVISYAVFCLKKKKQSATAPISAPPTLIDIKRMS